jgi:LPXTG-motif cell wall-anchored protein
MAGRYHSERGELMNTTTIIIIIVVLLLLGGGWGYTRRGRM